MTTKELTFAQRTGKILLPLRGYLYPVIFVAIFFLELWKSDDLVLMWSIGGGMLAVGIILRLWGIQYIGGMAHTRYGKRLKRLITGGPFGYTRNPLYIANIIIIAGYCFMAGLPWMAGLGALVTYLEYFFIVLYEETLLDVAFGDDYLEYKKLVPRWNLRFTRPAGFEPMVPHGLVRAFRLEIGGIIGTLFAIGMLIVKEHGLLRFSLYTALGTVVLIALFTTGHRIRYFLRDRKKNKGNNSSAAQQDAQPEKSETSKTGS